MPRPPSYAAETAAMLRRLGYKARQVPSNYRPIRRPGVAVIDGWADIGPRVLLSVEFPDTVRDHEQVVDVLTARHFRSLTFWAPAE